ncbi:MAG: hypothetical protein GF355_03635, partial [Candidatus Eisenbacteria bacterium]|nr:hypothetical protein [Candidatus Eisenbacteria bacterium]
MTDLDRHPTGLQPPDYTAHPYLDPDLPSSDPRLLRSLYRQYLRIRGDDASYNTFLNKLLRPSGVDRPLQENLREAREFLAETGPYLHGLVALLPPDVREPLSPLPDVEECDDVRELLTMVFEGNDYRRVFEAQREIYLSKLFFDVDHTWEIQRGLVHKRYFESLMDLHILQHTESERNLDICFNMHADGVAIEYTVG